MGWKFDIPCIACLMKQTMKENKALWEKEDLGGITEDNNRVPMPVVLLVLFNRGYGIFRDYAIVGSATYGGHLCGLCKDHEFLRK